jgi:hypothetical protein
VIAAALPGREIWLESWGCGGSFVGRCKETGCTTLALTKAIAVLGNIWARYLAGRI